MMYKIGTEGTQNVNCECSPEIASKYREKGGWKRDGRGMRESGQKRGERREERGIGKVGI